MKKRNQYSAEFKTKVVIEVLREEGTVAEIAEKHGINSIMLGRWKTEFLERATDVFKRGASEAEKKLDLEKKHVSELEMKVGQLTYEVDWLKKKRSRNSSPTPPSKSLSWWIGAGGVLSTRTFTRTRELKIQRKEKRKEYTYFFQRTVLTLGSIIKEKLLSGVRKNEI